MSDMQGRDRREREDAGSTAGGAQAQSNASTRINPPHRVLTPRDIEFIAMYASGADLAGIGEAKYLSYIAVQKAMSRARERVGALSLTHLCVLCRDAGLIAPDGSGYSPVIDERVVG